MAFRHLKSIGDFCILLAIWLSISSCVMCQAPTQKPIAAATTPKPGNIAGGITSKDNLAGNVAGSIVVEIQTPPTTPSNLNSIINAKPAENRPIAPTQPPKTTPKPNVGVTVSNKPPNQTTQKPNVGVTVSNKPPITPTKLPLPGGCPVANLMATKTGFLSAPNDPCSYVACIRADNSLHCALQKCDPGQAFSAATGRSIASN